MTELPPPGVGAGRTTLPSAAGTPIMMANRTRTTAVVFDLDGTLVDTMASTPSAYADTIRALGGPPTSAADVVAAWHLGPTSAVLAHFLGRPARADDLAHFYHRLEMTATTVQPFPGVTELITTLGHAGYRLAVFTSATCRTATLMLAASGLADFLPIVVSSDDITEPKPAPQGLQLVCRWLQVNTAETAYVGDAEVDLRCADAAGAVPVHAVWGSQAATQDSCRTVARRPGDVTSLISTGRI